MRISDWSSDVCSSDLVVELGDVDERAGGAELIQAQGLGGGLVEAEVGQARVGQAAQVVAHGADRVALCHPVVDRRLGILALGQLPAAIGRASWREGVWQCVSISVVAVSIKKKK